MTRKHIEIVPYNQNWPRQYDIEATKIKQALGEHCVAIYHIGSTSIPGLSSKNILDILCVVDKLPASMVLETIGYTHKGEYNIPLRLYFQKKISDIQVNLHVVEPDHGFIALNLSFRDYLRTHEKERQEYALLKESLLQDPASYQRIEKAFTGYNLGKDDFIKGILEKTAFDKLIVNFCMHHREWIDYHRIRKSHGADLNEKPYDPKHSWFSDPQHFHFVLYKGTRIIGIAHIEILTVENDYILRDLALDTPFQNQEFISSFLQIIEKWLIYKGTKKSKNIAGFLPHSY